MVITRPKGKHTYEDYAATPDDERWELIDGVLYRMAPAPNTRHQRTLRNLVSAFVLHFSRVGQTGEMFFAPTDVILSDRTTVEPDLFFVAADRDHIVTLRGCEGPPDLVVEVLSPSNSARDLETKRELYARHSIPEYFILNTDAETGAGAVRTGYGWRRRYVHIGGIVPTRRHAGRGQRSRTGDCGGGYFCRAAVKGKLAASARRSR